MNDEDNLNEDDESTITLAHVEGKDEQIQAFPTGDESSCQASCEIFLEFLEVAIHQILYVSKLYPKETFITRKKYNIPVHISGHPGLTQYIIDALASLKPLLTEDKVCSVAVLIKNGEVPCQRFLFELSMLQTTVCKDEEYIELHQNLRSFLLKILSGTYNSDVEMKDSSSFEILVGCYAECEVYLNVLSDRTSKWAKVDGNDFPGFLKSNKLTPIKALTESSILKMQLLCDHINQ